MFVSTLTNNESYNFADSTLIVPAISVGNVGQLSCDLLISNLQLRKVGYFCVEFFLPLVANNPFFTNDDDLNSLSLNTEVYHCKELHVTILQLRSPLVKGRKRDFCDALTKWFEDESFKELIILSSLHAFERTDEQLLGTPFRYLKSTSFNSKIFNDLKWKELEKRNVGHGDKTLFLPGAGFTKQLYKMCCDTGISAVVLLIFCSEGDNIPEADAIVSKLNQWKQYQKPETEWTYPKSWSHLFGNAPPSEIF